MDKFYLKWDGFKDNFGETFQKFREDQKLFDVTLVTDDGQHIQAHKMILSAGSLFFSNIFLRSHSQNMLVYLKGINSGELQHAMDFLYNGEASVTNEEIALFFETGKELQIKGLEGGFIDNQEPVEASEVPKKFKVSDDSWNRKTIDQEIYHIEENIEENIADLYSVGNKATEIVNIYEKEHEYAAETKLGRKNVIVGEPEHVKGYPVGKINTSQVATNTINELDLQILEIIEKKEGLWHCKVCPRTANKKSHIQEHAESHIEGMIHICYICEKTFPYRKNLRDHKRYKHSIKN